MSRFRVVNFQRIENVVVFQRYKSYEDQVSQNIKKQGKEATLILLDDLPDWLQRLSKKNGLLSSANTTYLLHGTSASNIPSIVQNGLLTPFSLSRDLLHYGRGLYFTDSSLQGQSVCQGRILYPGVSGSAGSDGSFTRDDTPKAFPIGQLPFGHGETKYYQVGRPIVQASIAQ